MSSVARSGPSTAASVDRLVELSDHLDRVGHLLRLSLL